MQNRPCLAALLGVALAAAPVLAQDAPARSTSRGFRLAAHPTLASFDLTEEADSPPEWGAGGGVVIGQGITSRFSVYLAGDFASLDYEDTSTGEAYGLAAVDLGVRYTAGSPRHRLRPYLELAFSQVQVSDDLAGIEYRFTGHGLTGGLGAEYFVTRTLAVDARVHGTRGRLTDGEFDDDPVEPDEDFTAMRFALGIAWHPAAGR